MKLPEPESMSLLLTNVPKVHEPGKRVIGFVIDRDELESQGLFSSTLEQYCVMLLQSRGYTVEKKKVNDRLTVENTYGGY